MQRFKLFFVILIASGYFLLSGVLFAQHDSVHVKESFPVVFDNDTLFFINHKAGARTAEQRSVAVEKKIKEITAGIFFNPDSLLVVEDELSSDIIYKGVIVHSVFITDLPDTSISRSMLAAERTFIIRENIEKFIATHGIKIVLVKALIAAIIILFLGLIIWASKKVFSFLLVWFLKKYESKIKDFYIGAYRLLSADQAVQYISFSFTVVRNFLTIVMVYVTLPFVFRLFPATQSIAVYMWQLVWNPTVNILKGIINYIPDFFAIVVITYVFYYFFLLLKYFEKEIENGNLKIKGFYEEWASPTFSMIKFVVLFFYLIVIYPFLPGSESKVFQGVTVFVGLLISIGSSSAIANIVAGMVITYMRPFKIGSYVKIGNVVGTVMEKSLLVTRILTIKNEEITIPNATVLSSYSLNYGNDGSGKLLIVHTTVTIGYNASWKQVHELLINAASSTQYVVADPKPFVFQTALGDFYISYQINAYSDMPAQQINILSELHQNIQDVFNEAGVEIMSPHYRNLRDGNQTSIPENYLDEKYKAPRFNVNVEGNEKKENSKQMKLNL